ncbi:hypothetical protein ACIHFD_66315 [Nonomuraea sp. NPDC051941]|uniref:hypothetical protein n=1 Tax=Nonomuraea sp. NPDC051941 TaxID=3364373 RepID=UPI0037CBBC3A
MTKTAFLLGFAAATMLATVPAQAQTGSKVVYGWAKKAGDSGMIVTPHRAHLTELGESGILAWDLGKKTGKPIKIDYTEGLDYRQGNKECGKRAAGHPYDNWSKKGYGKTECAPRDLYALLRQGRVAVRVAYDPAGPIAVKVTELRLP